MKSPTIRECLSASTEDIRRGLSKTADIVAKKYWFFRSKSETPVATLVCHIDTVCGEKEWDYKKQAYVYKTKKRLICYDPVHKIFWSPHGLGADDRAGVFSCLQIMSSMPPEKAPHFLFCDEEEVGCQGARDAAKDLKEELKDSLFLVELDRRGERDCVFYNQEPEKFVKYIERFGFKKDWGSVSDIASIGDSLEVCGTNLSIGFFQEHTKGECLYVPYMMETIEKTKKLLFDAHKEGVRFPNVKTKTYTSYSDPYSGNLFGCNGERVGRYAGYRDASYSKGNGRDRCSYGQNSKYTEYTDPKTGLTMLDKKEDESGESTFKKYQDELNEWMTAAGY